jgi:hypothetical protein
MRRRAFLASPLALPFLSLLQTATTHVALEDAIAVRQLVPQLYTLDDQAGGDVVTDIAMQCLNRVDHLLHNASYPEDAGQELMAAYGELAEMTGWAHFDNGQYELARFYLGEALRTAQIAGDLNLEVLVLASMNVLARYQGRPREALQVIQLAQRRAVGWAPPRLTALLAAREAVCKAQLGDASGSRAAMHRAFHAFHPDVGPDDPSWITFFNTSELTALRASASGYLGDMEQAAQHMRSAVDGLGPKFARNRAYYSVRMGLFAANHGDINGGIAFVTTTLPLFQEVKSRRAHIHLHKFVQVALSSGSPQGRKLAEDARSHGLLGGNS